MLGFHLFFGVTTVGSLSIFADPVGEVHFATSALNMEMIRLNIKEAGNPVSFLKGSDAIEPGRLIDENQHRVYLTKDFYLGKYEVTQAEYEAAMRGNDEGYEARPSNFPRLKLGLLKVYPGTRQITLFIYLTKKKKVLGDCQIIGNIPSQLKLNGSSLAGQVPAQLFILVARSQKIRQTFSPMNQTILLQWECLNQMNGAFTICTGM